MTEVHMEIFLSPQSIANTKLYATVCCKLSFYWPAVANISSFKPKSQPSESQHYWYVSRRM